MPSLFICLVDFCLFFYGGYLFQSVEKCKSASIYRHRRGHQIHRVWNYRQLWTTLHGCWKLDLYPLGKIANTISPTHMIYLDFNIIKGYIAHFWTTFTGNISNYAEVLNFSWQNFLSNFKICNFFSFLLSALAILLPFCLSPYQCKHGYEYSRRYEWGLMTRRKMESNKEDTRVSKMDNCLPKVMQGKIK